MTSSIVPKNTNTVVQSVLHAPSSKGTYNTLTAATVQVEAQLKDDATLSNPTVAKLFTVPTTNWDLPVHPAPLKMHQSVSLSTFHIIAKITYSKRVH